MWHAKPSGSYNRSSVEAYDNMFEIKYELGSYTDEAIAGLLGNVQAESGFNPWRWQGDRVGSSRGYGLFQFTPASGYLALSGVTPNMSVSETTSGATPEDGQRQVTAFRTNELGKWVSRCWRPYWNDDGTWSGNPLYPDLWALRTRILNQWGHGDGISMAEFSDITDIYDATFVFLACFEGPSYPNLSTRQDNAAACYQIITGQSPPTPPPTPPDPPTSNFDLVKFLLYSKKKTTKKIRRC